MPKGEYTYVDIGGERVACSLVDGQVRVHLPFSVRQDRLTELLRSDHYPVASAPGETDSQGWGHDLDIDDYYPYWVYPDPDRPGAQVFAFPPEDYEVTADGTHRPIIGEKAEREIRRWFDYLRAAAETDGGPIPPAARRAPARS